MARQRRYDLADIPQHVIQRGNNRSPIFACDDDRIFFKELLAHAIECQGISLHAYVLMTNHVHFLLTPTSAGATGKMMQSVGRRYVQYFNRRYGRSGTLWEGRYRATVVGEPRYLLACHRYIELNPVRAGLVGHPNDYPWSSYRGNALGVDDELIRPHATFISLGNDKVHRRQAYQNIFKSELCPEMIEGLREATNKGWVLGTCRFAEEIDALVERPVVPKVRGGDHRSVRYREKQINRV